MSIKRWAFGGIAAVLVGMLAACGGGGDDDSSDDDTTADPSANEIEEVTYDVAYNEDAVVIEADALDDVVSVSEDQNTVRLAAGSDTAEGLQEGDVVLIAEHTFGTVDSIETDGDEVLVELGDATLNQIIKDGEIYWKDDIRWDEMSVRQLSQSFVQAGFQRQETPEATIPVPEGLKFSGEIEGWEVELELKPTSERLELAVEAKYGQVGAVTGKGFISSFTEETLVTFEDSEFGEAAVRTTELETEMELEWHAFSRNDDAGLTEVAQFTIPASFDIPFVIGLIPFEFSIKAGLQIVPAFEGEASSGGSWKVNYKSSQGFKVDNTLGGPIGEMTGAAIDTTDSTETVTSGFGPAGFAFGVEFPRFELSVLGGTAMAFVTLKTYGAGLWTPGTTLTSDIAPCQMGFTEVTAIYGYELSLFGAIGVEAQSEIWKQRISKYLDDPCSLDGGPPTEDSLNDGPGDSEIAPDDTEDEEDCPDDGSDEEPVDTGDAEAEDPTEGTDEGDGDEGDGEDPDAEGGDGAAC